MVDVVTLLPVAAAEEGCTPVRRQLRRGEERSIGGAPRGTIEKNLVNGLWTWTSRDQVHHPGHRSSAVEGRGHALDHLDLAKIHGRNLQEPQAAALLAEQGKAIAQKAV